MASTASMQESAKCLTATRTEALASIIFRVWRSLSTLSWEMGVVLEPPPGMSRLAPPAPSVWIWVERISAPWPSCETKAAPAPSPQSMAVARSFQFKVRVMISEAVTRTLATVPAFRYCSATFKAKRKPEQAAVMSKVTA